MGKEKIQKSSKFHVVAITRHSKKQNMISLMLQLEKDFLQSIKFRPMSTANTKQPNKSEAPPPKRSLISYLCPCFNFTNHTLKKTDKLVMNNTEDSVSTLPFDQTRPKQSVTDSNPQPNQQSLDPFQQAIKNTEQSGIYIKFKENEEDKQERSQYADMQEEYQKYLRQQSKPKARFYPVNTLRENQLIVVGNQHGKILCKVKSVYIQPSESSKKKQTEAQKHKEKCSDPVIEKFWDKRYFLFQKFDEGIKLDQQSWFSVTPQAVAEHIASRFYGCESVLDAFCGAGGDSIKLALNCNRVVSNDIDPIKIKLLENNAAIYGVDNIETMSNDFFKLEFKRNEFEAAYMSPPWGGPEYFKLERMMPEDFIPPLDQIINKAVSLSDNVVLLLPKNTDIESIPAIIGKCFEHLKIMGSCSMYLEKVYFEGNFKFIILYIGSRVSKISLSDQLEYIYRLLGDGQGPFRYKRVVKKVRQQIGMLKLLNLIFKCEKSKNMDPTYRKLVIYLIQNQIIAEEKLNKLQQMDEADYDKVNQGKKQKKQQKKMIKSQRNQQRHSEFSNITGTSHEVRASQVISSPSKKDKLDQTISYVSSISSCDIVNSYHFNQGAINVNQPVDKSGVKIEELIQSIIPKE